MSDKFRKVRKLTSRQLCERYNVVVRTIDRWTAAGILPDPMIINGYRYWDEAEVEERDRARRLSGCGEAKPQSNLKGEPAHG